MNHDLIFTWLGLPPGEWPPDHYRLLGLEPGESNAELIEQRVHQRLDLVRRYQMMHPEPATEAMNRLAQAFVCLTEPAAKKVYDASLLGTPVEDSPELIPPADAFAETRDPLAWLYDPASLAEEAAPAAVSTAPPPLPVPPPLPPGWFEGSRTTATPPMPPPLPPGWFDQIARQAAPPEPAVAESALSPTAPEPPPSPEPVDPMVHAAQASPEAQRGLATKRGLYHRVARTRLLLTVWAEVGKYLASPKRRLSRADTSALRRLLDEVQTLLEDFPALMGEAGQPGYLVLALTQVEQRDTIRTLSPSQRESCSRDWRAAQKLLLAHRDYLRQEIRAMRKRGFLDRTVRAARAFLKEQTVAALLILLGLLALNIALWRTYATDLWHLIKP
jgi:hypothetical protein